MQKALEISKVAHKRTVAVENGDIRRFAEAVFSADPIHSDPAAAKQAGLPGLIAPPTFCATLCDYAEILKELDLNPRQVMHSEQHVAELEPVYAGDVLSVTTTLVDRFERTSGSNTMGFVILEDTGNNQKGKKVFLARRVLAVRGGFPRR
jgi:acyl dehydratase